MEESKSFDTKTIIRLNPKNYEIFIGSAFIYELRDVHPFEAYIINSNGLNADFSIFDDMPDGVPQLLDLSSSQPTTYNIVNLSGQIMRVVINAGFRMVGKRESRGKNHFYKG